MHPLSDETGFDQILNDGTVGKVVNQNKPVASIETGKWVGPVRSPISGEIVAVNEEAIENPSLINEDPYGKGWIAIIKPSNLQEDLKKLLHGADQVKKWMEKELKTRI